MVDFLKKGSDKKKWTFFVKTRYYYFLFFSFHLESDIKTTSSGETEDLKDSFVSDSFNDQKRNPANLQNRKYKENKINITADEKRKLKN